MKPKISVRFEIVYPEDIVSVGSQIDAILNWAKQNFRLFEAMNVSYEGRAVLDWPERLDGEPPPEDHPEDHKFGPQYVGTTYSRLGAEVWQGVPMNALQATLRSLLWEAVACAAGAARERPDGYVYECVTLLIEE